MLELKLNIISHIVEFAFAFNRTMLELKYNKQIARVEELLNL